MSDDRRLKKRERRAVGSWLREAADQIGLRDLWITVGHEPPAATAIADCYPVKGQPEVRIRVSREVLEFSDDEIKETLIHELVHAHHHGLTHELQEAMDGLSSTQQAWIRSVVFGRIEYMTDSLTRVLIKNLDLPPVDALRI